MTKKSWNWAIKEGIINEKDNPKSLISLENAIEILYNKTIQNLNK